MEAEEGWRSDVSPVKNEKHVIHVDLELYTIKKETNHLVYE